MVEFSDLYARRADYVFFLCNRLEKDEQDAMRLNQDVWRRIYRQIPQLRGAKEEHWLCNKIVDSHRKVHSLQRDTDVHHSGVALSDALMALDLEDRWPLVLKEFAGFGYDEIGDVLGVPIGTIRARVAKSRAHIRRFREECGA